MTTLVDHLAAAMSLSAGPIGHVAGTAAPVANKYAPDKDGRPMAGWREVVRNTPLIAGCWAGLAFVVAGAVAIVSSDHGGDGGIGLAIVAGIGALFHRATRMRIEMDDAGLAVHRLFRTELVAWRDVTAVSVDFGGLHIARADGS